MDDVRVINPKVWKTFALKPQHKLELCQSNDMFRLYNLTLNPQGSLSCPILIRKVSSGTFLFDQALSIHILLPYLLELTSMPIYTLCRH